MYFLLYVLDSSTSCRRSLYCMERLDESNVKITTQKSVRLFLALLFKAEINGQEIHRLLSNCESIWTVLWRGPLARGGALTSSQRNAHKSFHENLLLKLKATNTEMMEVLWRKPRYTPIFITAFTCSSILFVYIYIKCIDSKPNVASPMPYESLEEGFYSKTNA